MVDILNKQLQQYGLTGKCSYTMGQFEEEQIKDEIKFPDKFTGKGTCEIIYKDEPVVRLEFSTFIKDGMHQAWLSNIDRIDEGIALLKQDHLDKLKVGKYAIFKFIFLLRMLGIKKVSLIAAAMGSVNLFKYYNSIGFACMKPTGDYSSKWIPREKNDPWLFPNIASIGEKNYADETLWFSNCTFMTGNVDDILSRIV